MRAEPTIRVHSTLWWEGGGGGGDVWAGGGFKPGRGVLMWGAGRRGGQEAQRRGDVGRGEGGGLRVLANPEDPSAPHFLRIRKLAVRARVGIDPVREQDVVGVD